MKKAHNFKNMILDKAKIKDGTQTDNVKLGSMGSWAELFGDADWYIPELEMTVKGTCGEYCKGCFNKEDPKCSECYVVKSYVKYTNRNDDGTVGDILKNSCSVKLGHAYRTIAMTMYRDDLLTSLDYQLMRKRDKFKVIRINESGELTCYEDLAMWCELARRHPETTFYLYTKNYDAVERAVYDNVICGNIFINISIWHECGIAEYKMLKNHPQIRAFVLVDDEWTKEKYAENGIDIECMCPAYNKEGKMNHEVTCEKCKICYGKNAKCCGCFAH